MKDNVQFFPNEILGLIFSFVEPLDLLTIQQLSKYWNKKIWQQKTELYLDVNNQLLNSKLIELLVFKLSLHNKSQLRSLHLVFRSEMRDLKLTNLSAFTSLQKLTLFNIELDNISGVLSSFSQLTLFCTNRSLPDDLMLNSLRPWPKLSVFKGINLSIHLLESFDRLEKLDISFIPTKQLEKFLSVLSSLKQLRSFSCGIDYDWRSILPYLNPLSNLTLLCFDSCTRPLSSMSSSLANLAPFTSIRTLEVSQCQLMKLEQSTLSYLFPNLTDAMFECSHYHVNQSTSIKGFFPSMTQFQHLTSLIIEINPNNPFACFSTLTTLRYLKVQRTNWVKTPTTFDLHSLTNLTFLHFAPPLEDQSK
jgi:hypothetical protein